MIEIPEAFYISRQITQHLEGKKIAVSHAAVSPHKFAWYEGDPDCYSALINGKMIKSAHHVGGMVEMRLNDVLIVLSEGAYPCLYESGVKLPEKHQLLLQFDDGGFLAVSVRMYGGILAFPEKQGSNEYYLLARLKPSPLTDNFDQAYFNELISGESVQNLSVKALLATEQRIPGLGNGVLQDILYFAGIHPKCKVTDLGQKQRNNLFTSIKHTIRKMADLGGRDTEPDLFGRPGGYQTRCSRHTVGKPCSQCGNLIKKANYMGGSIYFCPTCQPF